VTVTTKLVCGASVCTYGSEFKYGMIPDQLGHQIIQGLLCMADATKKLLVEPSPTSSIVYDLTETKAKCFTDSDCGDPAIIRCEIPQIASAQGFMATINCTTDRD
jgi:hypothetical protein